MSYKLPCSRLRFLNEEERKKLFLDIQEGKYKDWCEDYAKQETETNADGVVTPLDIGYMMRVKLRVPSHLHDKFNSLPLGCEKLSVPDSWLSPDQQELKRKLGIAGKSAEKLIPNLLPKDSAYVHYLNLQLYLEQGIELVAIDECVQFHQEAAMEPYIRENTLKRKLATTTMEKNYRKFLNNTGEFECEKDG